MTTEKPKTKAKKATPKSKACTCSVCVKASTSTKKSYIAKRKAKCLNR